MEANANGNILIQAIALGHLPSLPAAREVVKNSFPVRQFQPEATAGRDIARARFEQLTTRRQRL